MIGQVNLFPARWAPSGRGPFRPVRHLVTGECPADWRAALRLSVSADAQDIGQDTLEFFTAMARMISGQPATQIVTTDPLLAYGLCAMARCLSIEAPDAAVQILLLDPVPAERMQALAETVPDEVFVDARATTAAGRPLVRQFGPAASEPCAGASPLAAWQPRGHIVLTGGNGSITHLLSRAFLEQGASVSGVTLIGRSHPSPETDRLLSLLRDHAITATWLTDPQDADALALALTSCRAVAGPISAVLHTAGLRADGLLAGSGMPSSRPILRAKLGLARDLDAATRDDPLQVFAGFSSLASVCGNEGQALYAFANGMLDGFLTERQRLVQQGLRRGQSVTFNWGYWAAGGMQLEAQTLASLKQRDGLEPISTDMALRALAHGIASGAQQIAVACGDRDRILERLNRAANGRAAVPASPGRTTQTSNSDMVHAVALRLRAVLGEACGRQPEEIDLLEPFTAYGVDSLMIVTVMQRLRPVFGDLPRAVMFEHGTVERMARWLSETHAAAAQGWTGYRGEQIAACDATKVSFEPILSAGSDADDIVIVGMAGQFPDAPDLEHFWQNLLAGHDAISEVPADRWDIDAHFDADPSRAHAGYSYARWGGFLDRFADFDPTFFGMTPREAIETDPQERLFLTAAWHALEDACLPPAVLFDRLGGSVGVFAGVTKADHARLGSRRHADGSVVHPRASFSSVANRVSFALDLRGPSVPVDTMCSSSLTALHQAREAILRGECAMALAGGVNLYQHPSSYAELCQSGMLARDGRCRSFGAGGTGFVPGEGVACLVLTTRRTAVDLGLRIEAVLHATAVNHGGAANGYTVPNPAAQRALVETVLRVAMCRSQDIGYVEAHGTGTALGDPIEVESLTAAFAGSGGIGEGQCYLGSVKSNIGHLEAAAGCSGVIKSILQMRHGLIVPTLHSATTNSDIDFSRTPFRLPQGVSAWTGPRRAIINSFGAGGANACALIEAVPSQTPITSGKGADLPNILVLSAKTRPALLQQVANLLGWLQGQHSAAGDLDAARQLVALRLGVDASDILPNACLAELGLTADDLRWLALETNAGHLTLDSRLCDLADPAYSNWSVDLQALCYSLQKGRVAMPVRLAIPVASVGEAEQALRAILANPDAAEISEIARTDRADLERLAANPAFKQIAQTQLAQRHLTRIAGLWRRGVVLDWEGLYVSRPQLLSLPGYPFETRRLWMGDLPETQTAAPPPVVTDGQAISSELAIPSMMDLAMIIDELRLVLSQTMDISIEEIDDTQSFADYGLDSILGIRFVDAVNRALATAIKTTAIFDYPTLQRLAAHVLDKAPVSKTPALKAPVRATEPLSVSGSVPAISVLAAREPVAASAGRYDGPIAIIGQSGRYPDAADLRSYWANLISGHKAVRPVSRWPLPPSVRCRQGGFLDAIDQFDATFFNISGAEARYMDPQQRLLLEESWQALEQAGYVGDAIAGERCGIYVGCYTGDYQDLFTATPSAQSLWGNMGSVIPARIAYHLDLRGPAMAFDTACSSSLVAVDAACKALLQGEVDMAVAGGIFLQVTPRLYLAADRAGMLSPTGESYSFDARADGFVPGEGVGVVVLKRLADAVCVGDVILATIEGSAVNSNGKTNGLIAPSSRAQADLLRTCYRNAGVNPAEIGMIEAHGTGTSLGDPIEFDALKEVFENVRATPVALTSVKPAIGHAQFAAGIASLQKAVLSLQFGVIPANLLHERENPLLGLAQSGFTVPVVNTAWMPGQARLAGVSSFGASGTNAHIILREAPPCRDGLYHADSYPVVVSARSAATLAALVRNLADWCEGNPDAALGDVAYTLMAGRMHFEQRCGFEARSLADLLAQMRAWLAGEALPPARQHAATLADFVAGKAPQWQVLFPQDRPCRIALPGAVFERQSYWVGEAPPQDMAAFTLRRLDKGTFAVDLTAESPLLRDHHVSGLPVLPGFALPEMIRQAMSAIDGKDVIALTIRDLCWLRAIDVSVIDGLRLDIEPDRLGHGSRVKFSSGEIVLAQAEVLRHADAKQPLTIAQDGVVVASDRIRDRLVSGGIVHGPSMQALVSVKQAGYGATAQLAAPSGPVLPLSPVLLDSAVQAATVFGDGAATTMPFAVEDITLVVPAADQMTAYLVAPRAMGMGTLGGLDIDLVLPDGRVAIHLRGITARPIPTPETLPVAPVAAQSGDTTHALLPVWTQTRCDAAAETLPPEVVFHPDDCPVPAELWPTVPRVPLSSMQEWVRCDHIGLWVSGQPVPLITAEKALLAQVLRLVQAVLAAGGEARAISWTVLTQQALHFANAVSTGYGASLPGLFGSLAREYQAWAVRMADLDSPLWVKPEILPDRRVLLGRDGLWLEQGLQRLARLPLSDAPYRDGSVYVVIGGAGGVARQWSEHVLRHASAQLVWLGRSPLDAAISGHLERFSSLGSRPLYLQADARDVAALASARTEILARFGRIDGVVHSAITLADGGLAGMDWPRMDAALSAKLDTLDNMIAVFGGDMREFGLVFSSLQSFARMPGQGNYAAACTFTDSFALEQASRLGLPIKVVNWGYWADAGIVATEEHRRRMQRFGQLGLNAEHAFAALDALISGGPGQMAIAELQIGAKVTTERDSISENAVLSTVLADGHAPALMVGLDLSDASGRWRPIHARLGAQMDRFDPEMTDILAASVKAAGLLHPEARAHVRGLPGIFAKWWNETARVLTQARYLTADGHPDRPCPSMDEALARWQSATAAVADEPDLRDHVRLAEAMLRGLPHILEGRVPATQFMFPDGRFDLVNGVYHGNSVADFFNDLLADAVEAAVRARIALDPQVRLRMAEVGAGTGGTARVLFKRLQPYAANIEEYLFTDLSKAFLINAKQNYLQQAPYLKTRIFDVSKPPHVQGLDAGRYDIAVATNVLHATRDILQSLSHTKALLRQNGLILVNELIQKSLFSHLTFGLLEGWWAYDDPHMRLEGTPALSSARWRTVLAMAGFRPVARLCPEAEVLTQQVFIGQSDGAIVTNRLPDAPPKVVQTAVSAPEKLLSKPFAAPEASPAAAVDLRRYLRAKLSAAIEVDEARIEDEAAFERYGVDSILILQIVDALRPDFPKITSTVLFEYNSVARLSEYLARTQPDAVRKLALAGAPLAAVAPVMMSQPAIAQQFPAIAPARSSSRDVAIIGLAGQFAGCRNLEELWETVGGGETLFRPAPEDGRAWPSRDPQPAGYMDGADQFDPLFFAISPAEALQMDPQERIFLKTAYHAIENAGYAPQALSRQGRVAVLAGVMNAHYPTRAAFWSLANRLSFLFDFKGPSISCDTACSSSGAALVLALDMLRSGRCDLAIAGGVNVISHPRHLGNLAALGIQSRQGQILPFAAEADGMLSGEGVGVVVLKTLDRALADGDRIEAVLRGGALNSGGRSSSYTAPSPAAHAEVITLALADAGVTADRISLVEAHGTGTRLGDPIEVEGLRRALGKDTQCAVSSIKANIGHTESAAAMAGLFKIIAQMREGQIAPVPYLGQANPEIDLSDCGLYFPRDAQSWPAKQGYERLAGLSSFGAGGANAHLVIAEAPSVLQQLPDIAGRWIVPLSARSSAQLQILARGLLDRIESGNAPRLVDIAFTLQMGRDSQPTRWLCEVSDLSGLATALRVFLAERAQPAGSATHPLAQAWLKGDVVDWASLWSDQIVRRVALPVYPFAVESYWLGETTSETAVTDVVPTPVTASRKPALELVVDAVGQILGIAPDRLDADAPLDSYGLDSVMVIRATDRLEAVFGPLAKTLFYEYRSLNALADHLSQTFGNSLPLASPTRVAERTEDDPIAIIGLAGRYPQAETLEDFWQVLSTGRDCISTVPAERWDHDRFYSSTRAAGKTRSRWGGFLNGVDLFDAAFFGILPKDADLTDPQERLFVETAWHALEDAGHCPESLSQNGKVGVFVGVMYSEYQLLGAQETALGHPTALSASPASIANRISYLFDFQGPSMAVDTMCASSLTAIHLAVRAIRSGECSAAIAGGVNLSLHPNKYLMMAHGGFEATDGRCRSFGAGGTGYVPSEGVGAVVLKPLSKALADGDPVWAVIRGSAVNHGGRSNGYTVPDPVAQSATIHDALVDGQVDPAAISYVECHGTGTALGDPIEIAGLKRVFAAGQTLALGSVKSNIGHCESAAGVAGLTKVILQMQHRMRVPSLHSDHLNPDLAIEGTGFVIDQSLTPWTAAGGRLLAGISSFGAGGSNAHLVLEEAPKAKPATLTPAGPFALVLSARSPEQIAQMATALADRLAKDHPSLEAVAYTLQTGRRPQPVRAGVIVASVDEAIFALRQLSQGALSAITGDDLTAHSLRRWLAGERVDWHALYQTPPQRVHLPLYPFARKSYWGVPRKNEPPAVVEPVAAPTQRLAEPAFRHAQTAQSGLAALPSAMLTLFHPVWSRDESPTMRSDAAEYVHNRLVVDLTGRMKTNGDMCMSLPLTSPEQLVEQLVAKLGPMMAGAKTPRLVQFALPTDMAPLSSALAAFAGTLSQERRELATQVVELGVPSWSDNLEQLMAEQAATADAVIRLRNDWRFIRHLQSIDLPSQSMSPPRGLVVISGGMGGLGQIFSADIAARSPDTPILLLGRRALDAAMEAKLRQIGAHRMSYATVDITDAQAVAVAIANARDEFGPVEMVIHSAGILRDSMVMSKSPADARMVVATKVAGVQALDQATQNDPLLAFVLCSSLAGVTGNVGQADYAFGNAWLDGFAAVRQGPGRTLSLNWPLWAEGGMTVPAAVRGRMLDGYGLLPMPAVAGLEAMWRCLSLVERQVIVAFGQSERIVDTLDGGSARRTKGQDNPVTVAPVAAVATLDAASAINAVLTELVAEILRVPVSEVQSDAELGDYGFDSIALTDLAEKCTGRLGVPINPSFFYSFGTLRAVAGHLATEIGNVRTPDVSDMEKESPRDQAYAAPQALTQETDDAVAIVGMSGAFPGAPDIATFWRNLVEGRAVISEIPPERWDWRALMGDPKTEQGKTDIRWGGFLDDIASFDPLFFGISPREAETMDPHQRLLLTHAWRAIENAGMDPAALSGTNTAVFMATAASEYAAMAREAGLVLQQKSASGVVGSLGPNRISHFLNLAGPSEPVETACSSGLVALHRAVEAIRGGCEGALVGAVNTMLMPHAHISFARSGMLSPDGQCRSFAADANGYVRSEGVAVLLLRNMRDARREGLPVYGVIRATGVNHGGRSVSLFAPNAKAQARLISDVMLASDIDPATVTAIEAHGTGTLVGDPIEIEGLKQGFDLAVSRSGRHGPQPGQIALSSVKSWIGHGEVAAGMAGLIKLLLEMRDGVLIPDANRSRVNPAIRLDGTPFRLVDKSEPWTRIKGEGGQALPRRAGISSFGFGGVNAHAVIEEAPPSVRRQSRSNGPEVIVLSAQSSDALMATARQLLNWTQTQPSEPAFDSLAATLQIGRSALRHRLAFSAGSITEMCQRLSEVVNGTADKTTVFFGVESRNANLGPSDAAALPDQLARDWVVGRAVRWPDRPVGLPRLALPPTAMDMRRCWFTGGPETLAPVSATVPDKAINAASANGGLMARTPEQHAGGAVYAALFDATAAFVQDHRVQDDAVLPGAAYAAMVHAAASNYFGSTVLTIRDLSFERMARAGDLSPPLTLRLSNEHADSSKFSVESASGVHARGRVARLGYGQQRRIDLAAYRARVSAQLDGRAFYDLFARMGLNYGPGFRLIEGAVGGDGFVLTMLKQVWPHDNGYACLHLPPNLLDAALQSTLGFTLMQTMNSVQLMVPVKINRIDIYAPLGTDIVVLAQQSPDSGGRACDIAMCAPDGTVLVDLHGFIAARVGPVPTGGGRSHPAGLPVRPPAVAEAKAEAHLQKRISKVVAELAHMAMDELPSGATAAEFEQDCDIPDKSTGRLSPNLGEGATSTTVFDHSVGAALSSGTAPMQAGVMRSSARPAPDAAIQNAVIKMIADIVHLLPSDLTEDTAFFEIGLDSIAFTELAGRLSVLLCEDISPTILYECATIEALLRRVADVQQIAEAKSDMAAATPPAPQASLTSDLLEIVTGLAHLSAADLDSEAAFADLGFDSVNYAELTARIKASFDVTIEPHEFYGLTNVTALAARLAQDVQAAYAPTAAVPVRASPPGVPAVVATVVETVAEFEQDCDIPGKSTGRLSPNLGAGATSITVFDHSVGAALSSGTAPMQAGVMRSSARPAPDAAIQNAVIKMIADIVHLLPSDLTEDTAFSEIGLDSIAFTELAGRLSVLLCEDISPTILYECATIEALLRRVADVQQIAEAKSDMAAATPPAPQASLTSDLLEIVTGLAHLSAADLDSEAAFADLGFDSVNYAELTARIKASFDVTIEPHEFYGLTNVTALAARLAQDVQAAYAPTAAVPVRASPPGVPAVVATVVETVASKPSEQGIDGFAIIGMSGKFPGAADPQSLWQNMLAGKNAITRPPEWRWDWKRIDGDPRLSPGRTNVHWGGFIDGLADFDPAFFGLSGAEAEIMDPQQRLMMMHVWSALESAGYAPRSLGGSKTGLYMGVSSASYSMMVDRAGRSTDPRWVMGNVASMGLNRISHMLDLRGPSEPFETACSSSLVALHRGIEDLRSGVCDMIVAGGVNAMPNEDLHVAFSAAGMLSVDGACKTFDKDANGYVRGEGIGVVVLRRLQDAMRDGNEILGVIRATGVRHAGRAVSLTAPNPQSQAALIHEVIDRSGMDPATISYIEAHGTGTALGDPIEIEGLKSAFDSARKDSPCQPGFCAIGTVKTHVGHLEIAAGVTGLIKVLLQMKHRQIVGNLHCRNVNPLLRLEGSPFRLAKDTESWTPTDADGHPLPLRAGISSFGFGGVNAHVLVEEPPALSHDASVDPAPQAVLLSAATEAALRAQVENLSAWIADRPWTLTEAGLLARIAVTLQDGRDGMTYRLAMVVRDVDHLAVTLRAWLDGHLAPADASVYAGQARRKQRLMRADDLHSLVAKWARARDLRRASEAWVEGLSVDWQAFRDRPVRKLCLPTYPFECKPYWVGTVLVPPVEPPFAAVQLTD
ncbi:SDR family NAD(P)-dependent oxidoreductase [Agrobacterium vitis]